MKAIIAVNNIGFIGKDNKLFWKSKEDLNHFKKLTTNKVLLCGYNTYKALPKVVKERTCVICDTRNQYHLVDDIVNSKGVELKGLESDIWCIGGKKTYEKYAPYFTELHISHINHNGAGDCVFPDLKNLNPNCKIFNYYFEADEN